MTAATTIVRQPALASSPQPTSNGASANRSMYEGSQTPTPAEERVTAVCGMEVRAAATGERREPIAGFDRVRIAVVLKVRGRNRMLVPWRDELHEQPYRGRGENAVRPYDLGPPPRRHRIGAPRRRCSACRGCPCTTGS